MSPPSTPPSPEESPRPRYRLKAREFERVNPEAGTVKNPSTDVHAILRDNIARATEAGLNEVKPPTVRRSRRKRDYWIALITVDLALAIVLAVTWPQVHSVVTAGSGIIFWTGGLTWLMWFVMDDY